jgi:hypothetical protein
MELVDAGYKLVAYSARPWADYERVKVALDHYGIPYTAIVCGKMLLAALVDDRVVNAREEDWVAEVWRIEVEHS